MKLITKFIAYIIITIDNALYKAFGIVSPMRRAYWHRRAKAIQRMLNVEHKTNI